MSDRSTAASSEVKRLFGEEITPATSQTERRTATMATPTPSGGVEATQVVPAQRDVGIGPDHPADDTRRCRPS